MFLSITYVTDAKYYASNSRIDSNRQSVGSGHYATFLPYNVQYDDKIHFVFNTKPTHTLIGIGTSSSSCFVLEFNTNQTRVHRDYLSGSTYGNSWLDSIISEFVLEPVYLSSSEDKTNVYRDDSFIDYWRCQLRSRNNSLRVDKFTNDDFNIDIIVL